MHLSPSLSQRADSFLLHAQVINHFGPARPFPSDTVPFTAVRAVLAYKITGGLGGGKV